MCVWQNCFGLASKTKMRTQVHTTTGASLHEAMPDLATAVRSESLSWPASVSGGAVLPLAVVVASSSKHTRLQLNSLVVRFPLNTSTTQCVRATVCSTRARRSESFQSAAQVAPFKFSKACLPVWSRQEPPNLQQLECRPYRR